jgi:hypothetical protein
VPIRNGAPLGAPCWIDLTSMFSGASPKLLIRG